MHRTVLISALLAAAAGPAFAQQGDFSKVEVKAETVAPGVAVLTGAGGNIGLSYGEDGNVLIDDQFAPLTDKILAAVKTLDPDPVSFLVNTHFHGDHTGGNENFGKAGTVIVAHDNVRTRLAADQVSKRFKMTVKATPKAGLPVVTFDQGMSFHLNGDMLRVVHVPNAHTDGDSLIYWTRANVLHMGDTFFHKISLPFIDLESGGSIDGAIAATKRALEIVKPGAKIIPGHGPVASIDELKAYQAMLVDIRAKVADHLRAGRSRDEVIAAKPAAAYGVEGGFISADEFAGTVYDSLAAAAKR